MLYLIPYTITGAVRAATKRAGGTVHNHGGSPGKRLGVKKFSGGFVIVLSQQIPIYPPTVDQYVIPGNIIVRQRGTLFHPGQHVRLVRSLFSYIFHPIVFLTG